MKEISNLLVQLLLLLKSQIVLSLILMILQTVDHLPLSQALALALTQILILTQVAAVSLTSMPVKRKQHNSLATLPILHTQPTPSSLPTHLCQPTPLHLVT